jgi:hypothetical protein
MGCVEDDAVVDDLAIVVEGARIGGREILLYDEIVAGDNRQIQEPPRPVSAIATIRPSRQML